MIIKHSYIIYLQAGFVYFAKTVVNAKFLRVFTLNFLPKFNDFFVCQQIRFKIHAFEWDKKREEIERTVLILLVCLHSHLLGWRKKRKQKGERGQKRPFGLTNSNTPLDVPPVSLLPLGTATHTEPAGCVQVPNSSISRCICLAIAF